MRVFGIFLQEKGGSIISVVGNATANLIGLFECRKTY